MAVRVAALQMRSGRSIAANVDAVARGVAEASAGGVAYLQTPEMTTVVDRDRAALLGAIGDEHHNPALDAFRAMAREAGIVLHVGSMAVRIGDGDRALAANRAFVIGPDGEVLATYDKIHLFDVDLPGGESWRESATYAGGDRAVTVDLPFARLGLAICYDLRFPQLFRAYGDAGVEMITIPAAFTRQTGEAHWHTLQRARAIENGCFVVSAAQGGTHEDGRETYGHSLIVGPTGAVLAETGTEPGLIVADLDIAEVAAVRGCIPNLKNARPFTLGPAAAATLKAAE